MLAIVLTAAGSLVLGIAIGVFAAWHLRNFRNAIEADIAREHDAKNFSDLLMRSEHPPGRKLCD